MTSCLRILAFLLAVLAAVPASGAQNAGSAPAEETPSAESTGPSAVLDDIAQGWTSQNSDLILRHFGSNKVAISLDGNGRGGSYSKDQGFYLFKDLFKTTVTRKFVFVQVRNSNEEGTATFAIAERRYQRRDDGRQIKDKVYIAMHLEQKPGTGRWVLDEIKSIR